MLASFVTPRSILPKVFSISLKEKMNISIEANVVSIVLTNVRTLAVCEIFIILSLCARICCVIIRVLLAI